MNPQPVVRIDGRELAVHGIHSVFARHFGFPSFYGRNMDAWVDCMTSLDSPDDGMTSIHVARGGVVVLQIDHFRHLKQHRPDLVSEIIECAAFVNCRRLEHGEPAVLALSFYE